MVALRRGVARILAIDKRHWQLTDERLDMLQADISDRRLLRRIRHVMGEKTPFDGVLADLAPDASGHRWTDQYRQLHLARQSLILALFC